MSSWDSFPAVQPNSVWIICGFQMRLSASISDCPKMFKPPSSCSHGSHRCTRGTSASHIFPVSPAHKLISVLRLSVSPSVNRSYSDISSSLENACRQEAAPASHSPSGRSLAEHLMFLVAVIIDSIGSTGGVLLCLQTYIFKHLSLCPICIRNMHCWVFLKEDSTWLLDGVQVEVHFFFFWNYLGAFAAFWLTTLKQFIH